MAKIDRYAERLPSIFTFQQILLLQKTYYTGITYLEKRGSPIQDTKLRKLTFERYPDRKKI